MGGIPHKGYEGRFWGALHQFLGLEEALEVPHLPDAGEDEDDGLGDGPPEHALVGALARHAETLLAVLRARHGDPPQNEDLAQIHRDLHQNCTDSSQNHVDLPQSHADVAQNPTDSPQNYTDSPQTTRIYPTIPRI